MSSGSCDTEQFIDWWSSMNGPGKYQWAGELICRECWNRVTKYIQFLRKLDASNPPKKEKTNIPHISGDSGSSAHIFLLDYSE